MKNILVTGGKGQLALCIKDHAEKLPGFHFTYIDVDVLDITRESEVFNYFKTEKIDYCINCAAYTAVDKAEDDKANAYAVNVDGAMILAKSCAKYDAKLIHISTDFVFDGLQSTPYGELDKTNPLSVYGDTKLQGERALQAHLKSYFIIRTSWLYSEYGHNFVKTMLRLGCEKDTLNVVYDQIGTPTYARDLAKVLLGIITENSTAYGIYHYSNEGVASWYDFAKAIFDIGKLGCKVLPIKTEAFPTPAKRPFFSVLDKSRIKEKFKIEIPYWRDSLETMLVNETIAK
jgi:dTDP-4-dehydrorhamnose reductase